MKTVLLDANELSRDWLCTGLKYQLIEHMFHATWINVYVPAVAFEEAVANHARQVAKATHSISALAATRRRLGLGPIPMESASAFDYRAYLTDRFDDRLGITVLPWPKTTHQELVARAVTRRPPFDGKGSGYRDSLIWADVVELAREGRDVALVSADNAFAGTDGSLSPELVAEVEPLIGSVELVRDFGMWLIDQLPWQVEDLPAAVAASRDSEFFDWYLKSDFQSELTPEIASMGFRQSPMKLDVIEVTWNGDLERVGSVALDGGASLVEYDLGQVVEFTGVFPESIEVESGWRVQPEAHNCVAIEGSIEMVTRVAVLFGQDEFVSFAIDALAWRRADRARTGD